MKKTETYDQRIAELEAKLTAERQGLEQLARDAATGKAPSDAVADAQERIASMEAQLAKMKRAQQAIDNAARQLADEEAARQAEAESRRREAEERARRERSIKALQKLGPRIEELIAELRDTTNRAQSELDALASGERILPTVRTRLVDVGLQPYNGETSTQLMVRVTDVIDRAIADVKLRHAHKDIEPGNYSAPGDEAADEELATAAEPLPEQPLVNWVPRIH
jgi:hypothetical protein